MTRIVSRTTNRCPIYPSTRNRQRERERVVAARLNEHMSQFELFEPLQSAYKARHSCDTALIHVQNNILRAMDQGKVGILLLLEMSAAFETLDHITMLNRLHT